MRIPGKILYDYTNKSHNAQKTRNKIQKTSILDYLRGMAKSLNINLNK